MPRSSYLNSFNPARLTYLNSFQLIQSLLDKGFTPHVLNKIAFYGIELIDVKASFKLTWLLDQTDPKKRKKLEDSIVQSQHIKGIEALILINKMIDRGLWQTRKFEDETYNHIFIKPDYNLPLIENNKGDIFQESIFNLFKDETYIDYVFQNYGGSAKNKNGFIFRLYFRTDLKDDINQTNISPTVIVGAKMQGGKPTNLVGLSPEKPSGNVNSVYQYDLTLTCCGLYTQLLNPSTFQESIPWVLGDIESRTTLSSPIEYDIAEKQILLKDWLRHKTPAGKLGYAPDKIKVKPKFKSKGLPPGVKSGTRVYSNPELFPELSPTFQGLSYWFSISGTNVYLEITNTINQANYSLLVLDTKISIEQDTPKIVPIPKTPKLPQDLGVGKTLNMGKLIELFYKVSKPVKVKELEESNLILGGTKYSIPHFTREIMQAHFLGLDMMGQWKRLRYGESYLSPYCDGEYITLQPPAVLTSDNIAEYRKLSGDSRTPLEIWEGMLKGQAKIKSFQDETLRRIQQQSRIQDRMQSDSPLTQQLADLGYDLDSLSKAEIKQLKFKLKRGML